MVTMNRNDRYLSSGGASKDTIAPGVPGGLPHAVARDGPQPRSDGRTLLLRPWVTVAMAPVRDRSSIAWCAGGFPARHSAPNVFQRRPNR